MLMCCFSVLLAPGSHYCSNWEGYERARGWIWRSCGLWRETKKDRYENLIDWLMEWSIDWSMHRLIDWWFDCSFDWSIDWLILLWCEALQGCLCRNGISGPCRDAPSHGRRTRRVGKTGSNFLSIHALFEESDSGYGNLIFFWYFFSGKKTHDNRVF